MTRDEEIDHLNSTVKCKLAPSPIHGIGVFAMRNIYKGEKLYCIPQLQGTLYWYRVSFGSFGKLMPEVRELILQRWPAVVNGSLFLSPNDMQWAVTYVNHSNDPNYDVDTDTAIRDIKVGEEITENYRLMDNYKKAYPWLKTENN